MNKKYIPLLITMLLLGLISGNTFGQNVGGQRYNVSGQQAPKRERQAKVTMVTVESVVKDANGQALPNVLISGKEGAIEVMTDANGHFKITVPENTDLLFESEGLESKVISLKEPVPATVTMIKAAFLMEDRNLVNIAFGQVKRKELIGAVSTLDPKKVKLTDDNDNFLQGLVGAIPGLQFNQGMNNSPNAQANFNIRGLGSAIFIIDGVPRDPRFLHMSEIEQISVLKDGNAGMLWGTQSQNGVIQITTRRGTPYKRKVEVTVEKGFQTPVSLPNYLNSGQYYTLYNEAAVNDGLVKPYADSTIAHYTDGRNKYRYPSVNYYGSEFLRSYRPFSRVLTEMSGGNDNTKYYSNVEWNRTGTLFSTGQAAQMHDDQFKVRGNVDFQVNDYIKAAVDAVVVFDFNKQPNGNFWSIASTNHPDYFSPLLPVTAVKHTATLAGQIQTSKKLVNPSDNPMGSYILGGTGQYTVNPYGIMFLAGDNTDTQRNANVNASVEADLKNVTQGLKFKAYMSFDIFNRYMVQTVPTYAIYNPTWQRFGARDSISALAITGTDYNPGTQNIPTQLYTYDGVATVTPYFERKISSNLQLNYDRTFNDDHHVTGTLLAYWQRFKYNNVTIDSKTAWLGMRLNYDYKQKYMVDFTSTYTNGYRLAPGHMGGYAPSVAVAWNMSEEDFMKDTKCIDYLKLRASASIQNIDPTAGLGTEWHPYWESFQNGSYFSFNQGTYSPRSVVLMRSANYGLTFEKMKSINAGLEGYFFNKLLYVEGNFFTQRWDGQVIQRTSIYPSWVGNNNPFVNYNATSYTGGDLRLTLSKAFGKFSFELTGNGLYATSKVVKRSEIWGYPYLFRQGRSADAIFGLVALGFFQNATDITDSPAQRFSAPAPGDIKYKDVNGDGQIDANDQVQIGNSQPKFSYGLNLVLKYGSFSLMATGDGATGFNYMLSGSYFIVDGNSKYSSEVLNRWTPATAATATYPRLSTKTNTNNNQSSTFWLEKGDFFRLNRVQLSWDVPKKMIQTWPTKEISLFVRGTNLNMWTTKQYQRQLNIGGEPNYRGYALGLNVLF